MPELEFSIDFALGKVIKLEHNIKVASGVTDNLHSVMYGLPRMPGFAPNIPLSMIIKLDGYHELRPNFTERAPGFGQGAQNHPNPGNICASGRPARSNFTSTISPSLPINLQKQSILFEFPPELRRMIYRHVLVSADPIDAAHHLCARKATVQLSRYTPIPDVSAKLLRTCRCIYNEALPVLYQENTFTFKTALDIANFRDVARPCGPQAFNIEPAPYGRLTLICSIILDFGPHGSSSHPPRYKIIELRDKIWASWSWGFFDVDEGHKLSIGHPVSAFPALDKLTLDFTGWRLGEVDGLCAEPIVRKLGEFGGLKHLVVMGIRHEGTWMALCKRLLKEGGRGTLVNYMVGRH